ncbi:DUF4296 domain-containing protein [Pontimicrobium sp. SW4]|uniref:DUF4296 domain-containing protein n=1 Tax=Pontimicrobium sp. SW4 TaxID=3153519 RepID=A0AAU7BTG1_9FLAO
MKHYKIFAIVCILVCIGCNSNRIEKPKKPKNLIKKEKMVNILYDMSILTASKGVNKKVLENNGIMPESFIFEKYDIDSIQFVLSNEYYAYNLDTYEEIYNNVKARLTKEKEHLDSLNNIEAEQRKELRDQRDSLNKKGISTIPLKKIDTSQLEIRQ